MTHNLLIKSYLNQPQHNMNRQILNFLVATVITLFISQFTAHAEPARAQPDHIRTASPLKEIIIPKVAFEQLTLGEALQTLTVQIQQYSDQKISPNFIIQDLDGQFENYRITLQLSNMPVNKLLQYVADQVRGGVHYHQHVIVIKPLRTPAK